MNSFAPVVVFAYKRVEKLKATIDSLMQCKDASLTDLIVYSDGYKNDNDKPLVEEVRDYLEQLQKTPSFKSVKVVQQSQNKGLAYSIIQGVTEIISEYGKVIVVEDDLLVSKDFLRYMNDGLAFYHDDTRYGCISAYTPPLKSLEKYGKDIYVTRKGDCWGWATWKNRWEDIDWELKDFDSYLSDKKMRRAFSGLEEGLEEQVIMQHEGKMDAWAARWCFHLFKNRMLTVYPHICRAINNGLDNSGEHCANMSIYENVLNKDISACRFEKLDVDKKLEKECASYARKNIFVKILNYVKLIILKCMRNNSYLL